MKQPIYIFSFAILGILLSFLVHACLEIWYIDLLLADFERWGFGLTWEQWETIHAFGAAVLFAGGAVFGFLQGRFWWRKIYQAGALQKFGIRVKP